MGTLKANSITAAATTITLLIQQNAFSYENKQSCFDALRGPKSDPKLIETICETATYPVIKTTADENWNLERERLQEEALQKFNQGNTERTQEKSRIEQELKNKARAAEIAAEERLEAERRRQLRQRQQCGLFKGIVEAEIKRGVPEQIAKHNLRVSQPEFSSCKNQINP